MIHIIPTSAFPRTTTDCDLNLAAMYCAHVEQSPPEDENTGRRTKTTTIRAQTNPGKQPKRTWDGPWK
jgi:hypothetical protein